MRIVLNLLVFSATFLRRKMRWVHHASTQTIVFAQPARFEQMRATRAQHDLVNLSRPCQLNDMPTHREMTKTSDCKSSQASRDRNSSAVKHTATRGRTKLSVVRQSDIELSAHCAGRMTISGRMADVCAELDRMDRMDRKLQPQQQQSLLPT